MNKMSKMMGIVCLALAIALAGCPTTSPEEDATSVAYSGYDESGNKYTLTISKGPGKAAYSPKDGDTYVLKIIIGNETETSTGTVQEFTSYTFTLVASKGGTFTVTVSGSAIASISGTFTLDTGVSQTVSVTLTPTKPADTWTKVTSFSQVNGSWKAPSSYSATIEGMTFSATTNNYIITFNAAAKTMSVSGTTTTTISGGNIDELWPDLKESLEEMNEQDGVTVTFNDANHSCTTTYNNVSQALTDSQLAQMGLQISQDKTQLKVSDMGTGMEIIYTKL